MIKKIFKIKKVNVLVLFLLLTANMVVLCSENSESNVLRYNYENNVNLLSSNREERGSTRDGRDKIKISNLNRYSLVKPYKEEEGIQLYYNHTTIKFNTDILMYYNRYYVPVEEFINKIGAVVSSKENNILTIDYKENYIQLDMNKALIMLKENTIRMRGECFSYKDREYLSLCDLTEAFNLVQEWDYNNKSINLYDSKDKITSYKTMRKRRPALIRLEDVTAGTIYLKEDTLRKLRIVAEYLKEEGVFYHVAWIPRYTNPSLNIDNDLLVNNNMNNADFIYTLDYMINRNGVIGIHGYTHQYGQDESIIGTEFSEKYNLKEEEIRERVEKAIETAKKLNIPYKFFESPHYNSTKLHQSILEEYFDYVYEPAIGVWNNKPAFGPRNHNTLYIPTPLSYIKDKNVEEMLKKIDYSSSKDEFISFFYHPGKELEYISFYMDENGQPQYSYSEDSILHKLIKEMKEKGYTLIKVTDIKKSKN